MLPTSTVVRCVLAVVPCPGLLPAQQQQPQQPVAQAPALRDLDATDAPYRTPRSGEGVRASLFGAPLEIAPRDRRSVTSWQFGAAATPGADDYATQALGSLYVWRRPDDHTLLRANLAGVYDTVTWARTDAKGRELMVTFENWTWPSATGELVDGRVDDGAQVAWGYVRAGIGPGYRSNVAPSAQDNMFATDLLVEPGVLYFGRGDRTAADFELPESTPEVRLRWLLRHDAMLRNLLELPHEGFVYGADAVYGYRARSEDWGRPGVDEVAADRDYAQATLYAFGITGVPGLAADGQERNRLTASLHAGLGDGVDRFSGQRVGGGPDFRGTEYETTARPWLPGACYTEFVPDHYVVASAGYRRELAFFAHLDVGGTIGWLDRDTLRGGVVARADDTLTALSARLSSGFVGRTLLQIGYAHAFDVVRDGGRGGDQVTVMVSGRF